MGVFVWARPRFLVVLLFLCGETQIWLGDLRVVLPWLFICFCLGFDMPSFLILANCAEYRLFHRLCIYQDRATEHLRPNRRKKKKCQYVLRSRRGLAEASPGLAQASPSLKAPRLQAFEARDLLHQHNRKGQVVMIKTRRSKRLVFGFVFCTLN